MQRDILYVAFASLLFSLVVVSCGDTNDETLLFGTWKLEYVKNRTPDSIVEIVSFRHPDTLYLETIINGTSQNQMFGKFKLSDQNRLLRTYYDSHNSFEFEILNLTKNTLELKQSGQKLIQKYIRINN